MVVWPAIKGIARRALRSRGIHVFRALPRGVDFIYDLKKSFPDRQFQIVFDVGANSGHFAESVLSAFPSAKVWCFEPNDSLHQAMSSRLSVFEPRVVLVRTALSSTSGSAELLVTRDASMSHLARPSVEAHAATSILERQQVPTQTLDEYCRLSEVAHIDLLKVDTEGHDLEVLRGAESLIASEAIACIHCECGMSPENQFHARFEDIKQYLENHGYRLFALYEQVSEWIGGTPNLRRVNAVWLAPSVAGLWPPSPLAS